MSDAIISHQLDLLRLEAGARRRVAGVLARLERELVARLRERDMTAITRARLNELLAEARAAIETRYGQAQGIGESAMNSAARTSAGNAAGSVSALSVDISAGLPTASYMSRAVSSAVIMGAPSSEWWARQAQDTAFRFAGAVRQGVAAGNTTDEIAARVAGRRGYAGVMDTSMQNARSLVHASIQEVANEARMETFRANEDVIEAVEQLSTLDGNTTDVCIAYAGMQWTLDEEPIGDALPFDGGPPRHWGCRSVLVPVTKTFKELGIDAPEPKEGTRASADGPVKAGSSFDDFLSRRTEEEQDEQLGKGRAQMWRDGKITLPQLLDQRGNPLTLAELEERHG